MPITTQNIVTILSILFSAFLENNPINFVIRPTKIKMMIKMMINVSIMI